MRLLTLLMALLIVSTINGQRTYSEQEIKSLADLGRLWVCFIIFIQKSEQVKLPATV